MRRDFIRLTVALVAALLLASSAPVHLGARPSPTASQSTRKPNIVFFLADDLGHMDIGANNSETFYETPNVDRLAREGMRFTSAYVANPVCSPTRYSVMTGKYPSRVGATDWFVGTREGRFRPAPLTDRMPLEEVTFAEVLRGSGYRTAFVGKWHLGPTAEYWPEAQGYEINVAGHNAGSPPGGYFGPFTNPRLSPGPPGEHLSARLANEAVRLINGFGNQPFLLSFSLYDPHTPLQAPAPLVEKYAARAAAKTPVPEFADEEQVWPVNAPRRVRVAQTHPTYAAMVETMDSAIGRVLGAIRNAGLDENTIVIFMSDNGGLSTSEGSPTSNLPFRGGKGWLYEGGIRVPLIVRWPGATRPGSTSDASVMSADLYPTILEMAGLPGRPAQHLDGLSLQPLLRQTGSIARDALFWHYPHYSNQGGFPGGAIRVGNDKLIERFEDGRVHLYDLARDLSERDDLAGRRPDRVRELRDQLHAWYRRVGAAFLRPRPDGPAPWKP